MVLPCQFVLPQQGYDVLHIMRLFVIRISDIDMDCIICYIRGNNKKFNMSSTFICGNCKEVVPVIKNRQCRKKFCSRLCKIEYYHKIKIIGVPNKGEYSHNCIKCGYVWKSDIEYPISRCYRCKTLYWYS